MKLVINRCYGGFNLSDEGEKMLHTLDVENIFDLHRDDANLIKVVEQLGNKANGEDANLEVVEIPDGSYYLIDEYDGYESIIYSSSEIHQA